MGNKLTENEILNLRLRAQQKCLSNTNGDYNDYIANSRRTILDFERDEQQWTFKSSGDANTTHEIYVWKRTASAIYFRIVIVQSAGSNKNIYLKWSLQADSDLAKSIQKDECAQDNYTASSGPTGITLRWDDEDFTDNNDDKTQFKNFRIFKYATDVPAVFGLLNYEIQKKFYDKKGNAVSSPASTKSTYTVAKATAIEQIEDAYDNAVYTNRFYCLVDSADRAGTETFRKYSSVFTDIIQAGPIVIPNLKCQTADTSFSVGTTDQETFHPAVELINPDQNQ